MIEIKNEQINKQTNKQINILDPKYISQIKPDIQEPFRETSCGCPTMIQTKTNKSINKQTNKQTNKHFLDPKYLS